MMRDDPINGFLSSLPPEMDLSKFIDIISKDRKKGPNEVRMSNLITDVLGLGYTTVNVADLPKILQQIDMQKELFHNIITRGVVTMMHRIIKVYNALHSNRREGSEFRMSDFIDYGKMLSHNFYVLECILNEAEKRFPWMCRCKREECGNRYKKGQFIVYIASHIYQINSLVKAKVVRVQTAQGIRDHLVFYNSGTLRREYDIEGQILDYEYEHNISKLLDTPFDENCKPPSKKKKKKSKNKEKHQKQHPIENQEQNHQIQQIQQVQEQKEDEFDEQTQNLLSFLKQLNITELNRVPCNVREEWIQKISPASYFIKKKKFILSKRKN